MKRISMALAAALATVTAVNAGGLDMVSRAQLRLGRLIESGKIDKQDRGIEQLRKVKRHLGVGDNRSVGMIKLAPGADIAALETEGVQIIRQRGDFAFVSIANSDVERVAEAKGVKRLQLARPVATRLDKARTASGVDAIHSGANISQIPYTGKGVITGIVDGGMDPNHINFRNAEGGSRVGYLGHIRLNSAGSTVLETRYGKHHELPVSSFTTDDIGQFHGTHTSGIMAGGYRGTARVAEGNLSTGVAEISDKPNPYYGVATESDIAMSCGDLMDMLIAMGMDDICQYAYEESEQGRRKPLVINLSLGSNIGPHDGTDIMHQYINTLVQQDNPIICISAGNEGDLPIALNGTFTEAKREFKTFIRPFVYTDMRYGNMVIYSEDATEFIVQAVVYNKERGRVSFSAPVESNTNGVPVYYVSSEDYQQSSADIISSNFARSFDGYIGIGTMTDENSGRYYAMIDFYTVDTDQNNGNYLLGFMVQAKDQSIGKRIDCYIDGTFTAFDAYGQEGWDDGMFDGTISDMACGDNTLIVGSYNTRDFWGSLDGFTYGYNGMFNPGEITNFSSYGRLKDGRELPHVCAPGAAIISSTNSYYVSNPSNGINDAYLHAAASDGTRTYNWQQTTGTSMSSPFVAGSIALWLEADPTLTINDIKDIVAKTARNDEQTATTGTPLQWGAGKFDALAGLEEVIRRASGINEIGAPDSRLIVSADGDRYSFFLGGASSMSIELYDMAGQCVGHNTTGGDKIVVDTNSLSSGVYIAVVNGSHTSKILIK